MIALRQTSSSLLAAFRGPWAPRLSAGLMLIGLLPLTAGALRATDDLQRTAFAPGDTVRVSMAEDLEIAFEGPISAVGTIPLPYLREFRIAGLTPEAAEKALAEALCKDLYQKATISIALIAKLPEPPKPPGKVYAYGAISKPGVVELPVSGEMTAMQLVSELGGLTSFAAPQKAYIMRQKGAGQPAEKIPVDLTVIFSDEAPTAVVPLRDGDVFFVPGQSNAKGQVIASDDCQIIVVGEVSAPGIVRFSPGEQRTLMRAIFKAAGFSKFAKDKAVRLIRYGDEGAREEQVVNVSEIIDEGFLEKDVELRPGDMIIVPQKAINF